MSWPCIRVGALHQQNRLHPITVPHSPKSFTHSLLDNVFEIFTIRSCGITAQLTPWKRDARVLLAAGTTLPHMRVQSMGLELRHVSGGMFRGEVGS